MGDASEMIPPSENKPQSVHYNDWPNSIGFDSPYEERTPVELRVTGEIPAYAAGVLFRTGMGPRTIKTSRDTDFKVNHWFDNFSQVHRFQIHQPEVGSANVQKITYNSRLCSDALIEKIRKTGVQDGFTFAAKYEPCKSFFKKIMSLFLPAPPPPKANEVNVGVTQTINYPGLTGDGKASGGPHNPNSGITICNKTDANVLQFLNPETLEPIGLARQAALHPDLKGVGSGAHAKSDPATGDIFNFNLDFGRLGTWRIFRVSAATGKTSVLATFSHQPVYVHSIFLTENHVILCAWNSHYKNGGASILWTKTLLDAMAYEESIPATWFVVDKRAPEDGGRGLIAKYEADPFFCFHTVNAYEEPSPTKDGAVDIVCDMAAYDNMDVLHHLYVDNILSDSPRAHESRANLSDTTRPSYRRYRLPVIPDAPKPGDGANIAVLEHESNKDDGFELPVINPHYYTKKHRYMYGITDTNKSTLVDGLVKYDALTHAITRWCVHGQSPGEPIFIPDPEAKEGEEDKGVLLSVVLDGPGGKSYLMCLDARDMREVGRAHVDGAIGFGFHGIFLNEKLGTQIGTPGNALST